MIMQSVFFKLSGVPRSGESVDVCWTARIGSSNGHDHGQLELRMVFCPDDSDDSGLGETRFGACFNPGS